MFKHAAKIAVCSAIFIIILRPTSVAAQTEYIHQPRISARIMGMGGAYTAVADDYNSLYFNPAGLARLEKGELNIEMAGGFSSNKANFFSTISSAENDANSLSTLQQNNFETHYSTRAGIGVTYVNHGFGIGIQPEDLTVETDIQGGAGPSVGLQIFQDSLAQVGFGLNLGDSKAFNIGIAPKAVYRAFVEKTILALGYNSNSSAFSASDISEGITFDADVGLLYTFQVATKPTFGLAVRNIIDEGFNSDLHLYEANSTPIKNTDGNLGRRIDAGSKIEFDFSSDSSLKIMADFRDMASPYATVIKCLHAGTELLLKTSDSFRQGYRVGYSEGYITAGLSLLINHLDLDIATYSEEIGTSNYPRESRRYLAQLGLDY